MPLFNRAKSPIGSWRLATGALLVVFVACGDAPTEPAEAGSLSFTYSGAQSGSFNATGALDRDRVTTGAAAINYGDEDLTVIFARITRSATRGDVINIALPRITIPRSFSLDDDACEFNPFVSHCPIAFVGIDVAANNNPAALTSPAGLYAFRSGTIAVTSVTATRIAGTFQGSAETLGLNDPPRILTVTSGTFDVPIVAPPGN